MLSPTLRKSPAGIARSGWSSRMSPGKQVPMPENKETKEEKSRETSVEFMASLAVTLVMVLFIMTFVGQTFAIPSSSMENTLLIGDHLFVNRVGFAPATRWL